MPDYADATNVKPVQSLKNLVDSSGGTASATGVIVGPSVRGFFTHYVPLDTVADGDVVTDYPLGARIGLATGQTAKLIALDAIVIIPDTTGGDQTVLHLEINATAVTGGVLTLTSAALSAKGVVVAGTAITALNSFGPTDVVSVVAASTTDMVTPTVTLVITYELDTPDNNFATLAGQLTSN